VLHEESLGEALHSLQNQLKTVNRPISVKRTQAQAFAKDKDDISVRILQMDFAMNYSCEYQNEVQCALRSRGSVALFTAATMHRGNCKTCPICSHTNKKEMNTVSAFINYLYDKEIKPNDTGMINVEEVI
jgi:hypothetical protein